MVFRYTFVTLLVSVASKSLRALKTSGLQSITVRDSTGAMVASQRDKSNKSKGTNPRNKSKGHSSNLGVGEYLARVS